MSAVAIASLAGENAGIVAMSESISARSRWPPQSSAGTSSDG